ncbi:MAG: GtrA family protein [Paludibacteraceae bacterium]|nr:GtrA family protein [Paludibacteraceae bacterium]
MPSVVRFIKFSASTLVGTAVDTAVLWLCAHLWLDGYVGERILAPTISFLAATVANFIVAYFFVWPDRTRSSASELTHSTAPDGTHTTASDSPFTATPVRHSAFPYLRLYAAYLLTCIAGFVVKMLFLQLFSVLLAWDVVWCNLLALCFSGLFNFVINDRFVFRKK